MLTMNTMRGANRPISDFYTYVDTLGQGAYGSVSRWRHKDKAVQVEDVAVKHIKWSSVWGGIWRNTKEEEALKQELEMLLILDNPFILDMREWFEEPFKGIYFVTELCEGGSLQDLLGDVCDKRERSERLEFQQSFRRHFRQIMHALSYLHGMEPPIIHRDLKPENVLFDTKGVHHCVKLVDFGLTVLSHAAKDSDEWRRGTMIFMCPQQYIEKTGTFHPPMDIWSAGVILYWMESCIELGSLQHPMLGKDEGNGFDVNFIDLYHAFVGMKDQSVQWNRQLLVELPEEFLDLGDHIFIYDAQQRLSAADVLDHPWVKGHDDPATHLPTHCEMEHLIDNIHTYMSLSKFDRTIVGLVACNVAQSHEDKDGLVVSLLRKVFHRLDVHHHGVISKAELLAGLEEDGGLTVEDAEHLFDIFDTDGSGLKYRDFLAATLGSGVLMCERSIQVAFQNMNYTGTGTITREELRNMMGDACAADEFLKEHDLETISLSDFRALVQQVASHRCHVMELGKSPASFDRLFSPSLFERFES